MTEQTIKYELNPVVSNEDLSELYALGWERDRVEVYDFLPTHERSLGFFCAYSEGKLVGYVNLAWDGGVHAFLLDTTVHPELRRHGIGRALVAQAAQAARARGIAWLHVDYEPHLESFYRGCGFQHTAAGLMRLR